MDPIIAMEEICGHSKGIQILTEEDYIITSLLLDVKRQRRWFDTSTDHCTSRTMGDGTNVIWSSPDVVFAEQLRLSRAQYLYVEHELAPALKKESHESSRAISVSPRTQIMMFLYQLAHGKILRLSFAGMHVLCGMGAATDLSGVLRLTEGIVHLTMVLLLICLQV